MASLIRKSDPVKNYQLHRKHPSIARVNTSGMCTGMAGNRLPRIPLISSDRSAKSHKQGRP